jgi:hypothetical protein
MSVQEFGFVMGPVADASEPTRDGHVELGPSF